jgi:nucleoside-diphosphate-sugar epimerase
MKILVIGGTGHIGSYLVPRLTRAGHHVSVVSRRSAPQYTDARLGWHPAQVTWINADRGAEEQSGAWAKRMAGLEADVVMDLLAYRPEQNRVMMEAFRGRIRHFIHCGTVWAYGPPERLPYEEHHPRKPATDYGRRKTEIEAELFAAYRDEGFPATVIHPGHISGRKWLPIDPQGSRDGVGVYEKLARAETVYLPDQGTATIHHVHGDDVAQLFELAMNHRERALGESFSAVTEHAMSLAGCCRAVAGFFGREANLAFVPLSEMSKHVGEKSARIIEEHVTHSPCASIAKGRGLLGYRPRYTTEEIYYESLEWLLESGQLKV